MIKKKDIKDVESIIGHNYDIIYLVSDKFRAISNIFGWDYNRGWLTSPHAVEDCIERLMRDVLTRLSKGKKEANLSTGGLTVEGRLVEDGWYELDILVGLL